MDTKQYRQARKGLNQIYMVLYQAGGLSPELHRALFNLLEAIEKIKKRNAIAEAHLMETTRENY